MHLTLPYHAWNSQGMVDELVTATVFFIIKYYLNFIKEGEREKYGALDALCPLSLLFSVSVNCRESSLISVSLSIFFTT